MRQRQPRKTDRGYLVWLRLQRCACGCLKGPPCQAAHLRASSAKHDKPNGGIGQKPDDCWALPLTASCHSDQHNHGNELGWWLACGITDPFDLCQRYYAEYKRQRVMA